MPEEILQDKEMLSMLIPVMRADLQVCASYRDDAAAVSCPVVTYSAKTDPLVESAAMASWRSRTPDYLGNSEFVGGHFFIHDEALAISADFTRLMRRYAGAVTR